MKVAWAREVAEGFQRNDAMGYNYVSRDNKTCKWIRCKGQFPILVSYLTLN